MSAPICPYCLKLSEMVGGDVIYPRRPDLRDKRFFLCRPCNAYVGCHDGTDVPLGRLADKQLRDWKIKAHAAFDTLWKTGKMKRGAAYKVMQQLMNMSPNEAHIGMFSVDQCKLLIKKIEGLRTPTLPL